MRQKYRKAGHIFGRSLGQSQDKFWRLGCSGPMTKKAGCQQLQLVWQVIKISLLVCASLRAATETRTNEHVWAWIDDNFKI